jgi:hypothetical protein
MTRSFALLRSPGSPGHRHPLPVLVVDLDLTSGNPRTNSRPPRCRQHPLPQLDVAGPKATGAHQQVVPPHAVEALTQWLCKARPGSFEVGMPAHERTIVVCAEVVQVFHEKNAFASAADLGHRRKFAVGEDVPVDECVGTAAGVIAAIVCKRNNPPSRRHRRTTSM